MLHPDRLPLLGKANFDAPERLFGLVVVGNGNPAVDVVWSILLAGRVEPDPKPLQGGIGQAPLVEPAAGFFAGFGKKIGGELVAQREQTALPAGLARLAVRAQKPGRFEVEVGFPGQGVQHLFKGEVISLHHEAEDISSLAAGAEAAPGLAAGPDDEGWGVGILVKGAAAGQIIPVPLQLDRSADNIFDFERGSDLSFDVHLVTLVLTAYVIFPEDYHPNFRWKEESGSLGV